MLENIYFYEMKNYAIFKLILALLIFFPKTTNASTDFSIVTKKNFVSKKTPLADIAPVITATGNQIYCPLTNIKIATSVNIVDPDNTDTIEIYIQISTGYVYGQDQLTLTGIHPTITTSWDITAGKLRLYSPTGIPVSYLDFIAAIQDVEFNNSSTLPSGIRNFSISIGQANYLPSTQHYYQYVPNLGITWTAAKAAAEASTYFGLKGYLATILAADEAQLSGEQAAGAGWIGGSDAVTEGVWKWVTGPEGLANGGTGINFWNGLSNGTTPNFALWNTNEPNQSGDEDYAHITAPGVGIPGSWNDLSNTGNVSGNYQPKGYIVEYGGMLGDPILQISASTTITISEITTITPSPICGSGIFTLQATTTTGTINWYNTLSGGVILGTGNTYITPSINTTTTYYADNGCPTRLPIVATINPIPTITGTSPTSRCDSGTVTLGATASAGIINWHNAPTGGTLLGTGTSFTTPSLPSTTTYYVDATASGCTTPTRTAITATVNITPSITLTTAASRCDTGTVTLGATASAGIINWYDVPTGGTSLGTGISFTTPNIASTTTYYVDATATGCTTTTRTAIIATINISPSITSTIPGARCDTGAVTLGAVASTGTINWYDVTTGGTSLGTGTTFTTPILTSTKTYYVDATASGCTTATRTAITASLNTTPTIISTTAATRCDSGTVTLGAISSGGTINWYNVATGGTALATGTSFTTPSIASTTTFYVDVTASGCTTSARTAIIATVNISPIIDSVTVPYSPCDSGTLTFGATASAGIINWYDVPTGGTSLKTGTSFTTPILTATTTYYVDATASGCTTPTRTSIIATVNITPSITSTVPASRCDTGTVTLGAIASAGTINWYSVPTGGTVLGTGTTFTTPSIVTTTTFYVDATAFGCTTATRTSIIATVNISPTITSTTPASRCDVGSVTLGAVASGGIINWYDVPTGGTSLGTGISFTTPSLTATTTFYVDASTTECTSARTPVVATIYPIIKIDEEVILCQTETATLDASIPGMIYLWTPGGETTQTIVVSTIGDYSVTISSPFVADCDSYKYIKVIEHPAPIINAITVNENSITIELEHPENYYEFSIDGELFQSSNQFSYIPSGLHTAYVREKNMCNLIRQGFTIFTIAKYFTPNNDGFNDVWEIKEMKDSPNSIALIFNRYGKLITTLNALKYDWDGKYNNNVLPADDYWYHLKMEDSKPEIRGHFSLKR